MIKNQRAYQLAFSKTHNNIFSFFVAVCARVSGTVAAEILSMFNREYVEYEDIEIVRQELNSVFEKPGCDREIKRLPDENKGIDVSVIIPAYNAEKYITACVDSILEGGNKCRLEIIVVNDNSSDNTIGCFEKYTAYENVKIIDFKEGGCAAKARNEGLIHSTGKFIVFVDSDDKLFPGAIDKLLFAIENTQASIVQGGWQYIDENDILGASQQYVQGIYMDKSKLDRFDLPGTPWGKIYKRELFEELRFPSEYTCFEDSIIHFFAFRNAERVASIKDMVYYWRKNPNGITSTSQNQKKALQSYWIIEEMAKQDKTLSLGGKPNDMLAMCLIGQLTNFCYVNVAKAEVDLQKKIFALCCELFEKYLKGYSTKGLPYAVRLGAKALKKKRFDLWVKQGKLYQLIR